MRSCGVLMHITSLPGPYGIGTMGKQACAFVDFLHRAGQSCWQMLPLNPTGFGNSPYQSCSSFAGNHYLIDLDLLVEEGLLEQQELDSVTWCKTDTRVDFGLLYRHRLEILRKAFDRFEETGDFARFLEENRSWLTDYAAFMCLKEHFGGKPWYQWPKELKERKCDVVAQAAALSGQQRLRFHEFVQYLFFKQWDQLRAYAHKQGVRLIGDVPIYVPLDSVEVWKNPELFQLDKKLDPVVVAGCPPDAFTEDGQLWGNPIYDWTAMEKDGFGWWIRRLEAAGRLYDVVRLDHFRGLESYWAVPYGDSTARYGKWVKGPGMAFVEAIRRGLPRLEMIAEDLGFMTPEVLALRDGSGFPGMKVLQFGFDPREPSDYLPHTYTANSVCYTGTHDNMTMRQWFDTADAESRSYAAAYMNLSKREGFVWGAIRTVYASVSDLCIVQMQDFLNLGKAARLNLPGTLSDYNWTWRVKDDIINDSLASKIANLATLYGRNSGRQ